MRLTLSLCFFWLLSLAVFAALPPLSESERSAYASVIVSGQVVSITKTLMEESDDWSDFLYKVRLKIFTIYKGKSHQCKYINFFYNRKSKRPAFWVGPIGQNYEIRPNSIIKIYLEKHPDGQYVLLKPNGFDEL